MTENDRETNAQHNRKVLDNVIETTLSKKKGGEKLRQVLAKLIGERCWWVAAGAFTGPALSLDFGNRTPSRFQGGRATERGQYQLYVEAAQWRVMTEGSPIASSHEILSEELVAALDVITHTPIVNASLSDETFDLTMEFESGARLELFCNCFTEEEDNFVLSCGLEDFTVTYIDRLMVVRKATWK